MRILILLAALVGVLWTTRKLNGPNTEKTFQVLGLSPGTPDSPGVEPGGHSLAAGDERFSLCKTRVQSFAWSTGRKIEETQAGMKMRWQAVDPQPREIGYMDIERWLSRHCQIITHPADLPASTESIGDVTIRFVDGGEMKYLRYPNSIFQTGGTTFRSDDLTEALRELQQIAQMNPSNGF